MERFLTKLFEKLENTKAGALCAFAFFIAGSWSTEAPTIISFFIDLILYSFVLCLYFGFFPFLAFDYLVKFLGI